MKAKENILATTRWIVDMSSGIAADDLLKQIVHYCEAVEIKFECTTYPSINMEEWFDLFYKIDKKCGGAFSRTGYTQPTARGILNDLNIPIIKKRKGPEGVGFSAPLVEALREFVGSSK